MSSALITAAVTGTINSSLQRMRESGIREGEETAADQALRSIVEDVNRIVMKLGSGVDKLMTIAAVVIDLNKNQGFYINGGHTPVLFSGAKQGLLF